MKTKKKKIHASQYIIFAILFLFTVACLAPMILIAITSVTAQSSIAAKGISFFPDKLSFDGWLYVWNMREKVVRAYGITIARVIIGVGGTILIESMCAFAVARQNFLLRNIVMKLFLFATLFEGGLLAGYIVRTQMYHLRDTWTILMLPGAGMMHIIMMRTYIRGTISDSVVESAKMDGASDFLTFFRIVLPLMKPSLAALSFMGAVGKWNEWNTADLYISKAEMKPLQNLLMSLENRIAEMESEEMQAMAHLFTEEDAVPADATRMALLFITLGPIMVAYPFFQKHFVKGLTVGAVKG